MKMNYIKELNAFKEWMAFHEMPPNAVLLWHTLMVLNNTARWMAKFNAPNSIIGNLSGLSSQRISESRKVLMENELIRYEPGVKGKAASYQIKSNHWFPILKTYRQLHADNWRYEMRNQTRCDSVTKDGTYIKKKK